MSAGPITFCSVASSGYVAGASAALQSLRAQHPDAHYALLLVDAPRDETVPHWLRTIAIEDCIAANLLPSMRKDYSIAELCFAAKPFLLRHLLGEGAQQVHYFDGDCRAYAPLTPLLEQLGGADLLLTPHALSPIPDDGHTPRPLTLVRAGVFNAGYIGVRNTDRGRAFATWLSERTVAHAKNAPQLGMCGDQRWLDLVPALFPGAAICRHRGANVAYWNLHERVLGDAGALTVDGEPLLFFHFSGFDPRQPAQLSKYQDRVTVVPGSVLHRLLQDYAAESATPATRPSWLENAKRLAQQWLRPATPGGT